MCELILDRSHANQMQVKLCSDVAVGSPGSLSCLVLKRAEDASRVSSSCSAALDEYVWIFLLWGFVCVMCVQLRHCN